MAGKLMEYAVVYHPKPRKEGDQMVEDPSVILVEPKRVIAKDEKTAAILAAREIPDDKLDVIDQVEILVRPF